MRWKRERLRVDNLRRHDNMTSEEKVDARVQAKLNMYDYATFVETDLGVNLCQRHLHAGARAH